ncbi:MAG: alpha-amylase [Porticoccaceae bacterium]|nr:alpha-amylase [Porticoccaceae bacterium]
MKATSGESLAGLAGRDTELAFRVENHLRFIYESEHYPGLDHSALAQTLIDAIGLNDKPAATPRPETLWDQGDVFLITYGDSILREGERPLKTLNSFLDTRLKDSVSGVHILPFFPYSSDDGFAVMDFAAVNPDLGTWQDIRDLSGHYDLMGDLVINHCSSRSQWFENFLADREPGRGYFIDVPADTDISQVVRARTHPLLREVDGKGGKKHVWCTFSHDQVDLNFANPGLLTEIVGIIRQYLDNGVRVFRLDAVGFIWKELGSPCINHPRAHEIVRLIRTLVEHAAPGAIIITETNLPNHENLSYFGNGNEAHAIYNFSLPPLLVHALVTGTSRHLTAWQMSMPPARIGTAFFNFIASHDGIGLRPAEGLLDDGDIEQLIELMQQFGGRISWRVAQDGVNKPYEINITLFDALQGTLDGPDNWNIQRFLCAHAIMLALEGIPALYIHSLIGTRNFHEGVEKTAHNRTINRYKWLFDELTDLLDDPDNPHARVFQGLLALIQIRRRQPAFHPNATHFTLHLGEQIFGFWRQSMDRTQSIFCLHNVSAEPVTVALSAINLISTDNWTDLITGTVFTDLRRDLTLNPYQTLWLSNR